MTESNAKIIKIVLALLAVVSIVLIIVFAVGAGENQPQADSAVDYSDEYQGVEDDGYDPMEDFTFSDDELYADVSESDLSTTDISESDM